MRSLFLGLILTLQWALAAPANAASPLVDAEWVKGHVGKPGVVFLDVRAPGAYLRGHVPGAVSTNYGRDGWRVKHKGVPGMLPEMPALEKLFGRLGISNTSHVVILPGGYSSGEMGVATRVYWTLKVAGHGPVSILDGGMCAYAADKRAPLKSGPEAPSPASYRASFQPQYLATDDDVKNALGGGAALIDSRPNDQFLGVNKSGKVRRHGTLPGAVNLPGRWTTVDDGGKFRSSEALRKLYEAVGAKPDAQTITFCNTGHWASLGWFVQREILGNKSVRMYDGSMADWSRDAANAMDRKVPLP